MTALYNVLIFLLATVFSMAIFFVLLRIFLQLFQAPWSNPISQFIAKITNPLVRPLRKILPRVPYIDLPSVLLLIIIELIKFITLFAIQLGIMIPLSQLFLFTFGDIIIQACSILFYAIIIRVIISWISSGQSNPFIEIVYCLTEPLMSKCRQLIPDVSGFDLSPIIVLLLIKVVQIAVTSILPTHIFF